MVHALAYEKVLAGVIPVSPDRKLAFFYEPMIVDLNCGARSFVEIMQTCSYLPLKDVVRHVRDKMRKSGMTMAEVVRKTREMDEDMNSVPLLDDPESEQGQGEESLP